MSGNFNLNDYETVKQRKARFYKDHPDGRIIVTLVKPESILDYALFMAEVFKGETKVSSGYAFEMRDKELSVSNNGKKFESVNYSSWTENAEESAVGRALDNFGYCSNGKCSQEEMVKAKKNSAVIQKQERKIGGDYSMPIGKSKGTKLKDLSKKDLESALSWMKSKNDNGNWNDAIANIEAVLKDFIDPQEKFGPS